MQEQLPARIPLPSSRTGTVLPKELSGPCSVFAGGVGAQAQPALGAARTNAGCSGPERHKPRRPPPPPSQPLPSSAAPGEGAAAPAPGPAGLPVPHPLAGAAGPALCGAELARAPPRRRFNRPARAAAASERPQPRPGQADGRTRHRPLLPPRLSPPPGSQSPAAGATEADGSCCPSLRTWRRLRGPAAAA